MQGLRAAACALAAAVLREVRSEAFERVGMNAAKTTSERVEKLRQEREALGLRRRELYAHDDDWPKLQELAAKLQRKRERDAKRAKG